MRVYHTLGVNTLLVSMLTSTNLIDRRQIRAMLYKLNKRHISKCIFTYNYNIIIYWLLLDCTQYLCSRFPAMYYLSILIIYLSIIMSPENVKFLIAYLIFKSPFFILPGQGPRRKRIMFVIK